MQQEQYDANDQTPHLDDWMAVPQRAVERARLEKLAYSDLLRTTGEYLNFFPGKYPGGIPNSPGPLQALLSSAIVGGGLGYGLGALGEQLMPRTWERGRLRKTLGITGALAGSAVPLGWMAHNALTDRPILDKWLFDTPREQIDAEHRVDEPSTNGVDYRAILNRNFNQQKGASYDEDTEAFGKLAEDYEDTGVFSAPPIDVDAFNHVIWHDSRVADRLHPAVQAAASGLVTGAAHVAGGLYQPADYVGPMDVGRMGIGLGARQSTLGAVGSALGGAAKGYLAGAVFGAAMGRLMGMPQPLQEKAKNVGLWAGVVNALAPRVFGE